MLFQKYIFLILCSFIFTIHAALDFGQLIVFIEAINVDVNRLNSAIDKFDGMLSGIAIVKAVTKLKDDTNVATREAKKGRPDYFPWEDSQHIAVMTQDLVVGLEGALNNLVAKVNIPSRFCSSCLVSWKGSGGE